MQYTNRIYYLILVLFFCSFIESYDSLYGADVPSELKDYQKLHGFPPDESVLFLYVAKVTDIEAMKTIVHFVFASQQPIISKTDIASIIRAKQQSIKNFECNFFVTSSEISDKEAADVDSYEFLFSGNKLLLDHKPAVVNSENPQTRVSYDGEKIISLYSFGDEQYHAGISPVEDGTLQNFLQLELPILLAMLFDTDKCGYKTTKYNLWNMLEQPSGVMVLGKTEVVHNRKCIVITSNFSSRVYLDIERDYSVVCVERFVLNRVDEKIERILSERVSLFDLRDMGNGIWLPEKTLLEYFDKQGDIINKQYVFMTHVAINKTIEDKEFVDFIPDETLVSDLFNNLVYKFCERPTIQGTLEKTVSSKRVFIYRYISIISGLALIFIALGLKYLAYLKAKRERKNKTVAEEKTK
jgi:hypothetical protein